MPQNICDCPNPPGGRATCSEKQIAVCRVRNGVVETFCIDPPRTMAGAMKSIAQSITDSDFSAKFSDIVLGPSGSGAQFQADPAILLELLMKGEYELGGTRIRVKLPKGFKY